MEGLRAHHSIAHSRQTLGFEFSEAERERLRGAVHPLVRTNPRTGRRALYLASHASGIIDWRTKMVSGFLKPAQPLDTRPMPTPPRALLPQPNTFPSCVTA